MEEKQVAELDRLRKIPIVWPGTPAKKGAKARRAEPPGNGANDDGAPDADDSW